MKFLRGGRALKSVMSRHKPLWEDFSGRYGTRFRVVSDYFRFMEHAVEITDLEPVLPELAGMAGAETQCR